MLSVAEGASCQSLSGSTADGLPHLKLYSDYSELRLLTGSSPRAWQLRDVVIRLISDIAKLKVVKLPTPLDTQDPLPRTSLTACTQGLLHLSRHARDTFSEASSGSKNIHHIARRSMQESISSRKDWSKRSGAQECIDGEAKGPVANCTGDYQELGQPGVPTEHRSVVMTLPSMEDFETEGDERRDEANNLAILQELKVNPAWISGINFNLVYGAMKGHKMLQSDESLHQSELKHAGAGVGGVTQRIHPNRPAYASTLRSVMEVVVRAP